MYNWEKILREDRMTKNTRNPSFSSTLLDEIYREIDGGGEELKRGNVKSMKKHSLDSNNGGGRALRSTTTSYEDEEMAGLRRDCLIEKWMEKKVDSKVYTRRRSSLPEFDRKLIHDNDPMFFSSGSSSSDSSFGGFSSFESESFGAVKTKNSCFTAPRPKPVKTTGKLEHSSRSGAYSEQREFYLFDDYRNRQTNKTDEGLIKSKTRALKIYANLKKVKQPISPGGRLTSFINNLFSNGHPKKNKNMNMNQTYYLNGNADRKTKSTLSSACSSATSFSRSCLSISSPNSKEKLNNGLKRSVKFFPVSFVVDEDSRPCGHKTINNKDVENIVRKTNVVHHVKDQTNYYKGSHEFLRSCQTQKEDEIISRNDLQVGNDDYEDDDDDDVAASDSSSDLFELDHLELLKSDRFCDDLPVYETTDFGLNRAIASGLIR